MRRALIVPVAIALLTGSSAGSNRDLVRLPQAIGDDSYASQRAAMVAEQIRRRGVVDARVLDALRAVPRHLFVPDALRHAAYEDRPLPIGHGQTISQPYIVAHMTEALEVRPADRVLEIGTGSGYQAAVLARLAREVFTIEIVPELAKQAAGRLQPYRNVQVREGDGYAGWPERAPFHRIMVTAAPERIPQPLIDQLAPGGRMVIPVGDAEQWMTVLEKTSSGVVERRTIPVRFVPFTRQPPPPGVRAPAPVPSAPGPR
jgi:protein-L-isoaspartate(D-aspartate) O-methyltransferase